MKLFLVLLCIAAVKANTYSYGHHQPEAVRIAFNSDLRGSSYDIRTPAYAAAPSSYGYAAPALRILPAPAVYEPIRISFRGEAPSTYSHGYGHGSSSNVGQIIQFNQDMTRGHSAFNFDTTNGIRQEETSVIRSGGPTDYGQLVSKTGSYSYTSPEGIQITTRYVADENGFRAEGAHLPTPPPPQF